MSVRTYIVNDFFSSRDIILQTVQLDARDTSSLGVKTLLYNAKDYILSQIKKVFGEQKRRKNAEYRSACLIRSPQEIV